MHTARNALTSGFRQSLNWRLVLPLYLTGLLFGLVQTWPVWIYGEVAASPQLARIAGGEIDALANLLMGSEQAQITATMATTAWMGISLMMVLLYGLAYNFLSGGILTVWAGKEGFWVGCRRFFWAFVGLGIILALLLGLVTPVIALLVPMLGMPGLVTGLVLVTLISLLGEYARAIAVARDRHNPLRLIGGAIGFGARHFPGVAALGILGMGSHLVTLQIYLALWGLVSGTLALVIVQQAVILLWLWIKLLRLAWAFSYVTTSGQIRDPATGS